MVFSMTTSLVQLIVPDHLRGRVVSIYMVAFRGGMPLGSLASGFAATFIPMPVVLAVNGALVSARGDLLLREEPWGQGTLRLSALPGCGLRAAAKSFEQVVEGL